MTMNPLRPPGIWRTVGGCGYPMVWPYSILLTCTCIHIHTYTHSDSTEGQSIGLCVYICYVCYCVAKIQQVDYSYIAGKRFFLTPGKCPFGYSFDIPSSFTLKEKEKSFSSNTYRKL
jgi:hypothetical protein